jgi:hypothetical protein
VVRQIGLVDFERRLGSDWLNVRLGAIYALERVMIDSARDHPAIVDVLAAFVRECLPAAPSGPELDAGGQPEPYLRPAPYLQAAVTVLGRRPAGRAELGRVNVAGADLTGADLTEAGLGGTNLTGSHPDRRAARLNANQPPAPVLPRIWSPAAARVFAWRYTIATRYLRRGQVRDGRH